MITVELKIPPIFAAKAEALASVLPEIAAGVRADIVSFASRDLGGLMSEEYIQGLQVNDFSVSANDLKRGTRTFATIVQAGSFLAQAAERGWAPLGTSRGSYNMKSALLSGRNAMSKYGGKRAIVEFPHQTAGTGGRMSPTMGTAEQRAGMSKTQAELLGAKVHRAAKKLGGTLTHPNNRAAQWGDRLAAGVGGAKKLKSHHKTDIYAGMVKKVKTYRKATQATYSTFRTVTPKSPGWIHPGIKAGDFFGRAAKRVEGHVRLALQSIGRGTERG